jgi:pyruvate dehydrogenase E2 component (dihydrolipoamide acetyltransferase)
MPLEFKMPDPGEGIHEAEVLEVLVAEGDRVEDGQTVMVVETDKANLEIPAPVSGVVQEIRVKEGDIIEVGSVVMVFFEDGEQEAAEAAETETPSKKEKPADEKERPPSEIPSKKEEAAEKPEAIEAEKDRRKPVPATPATRRLARELNVDLYAVKASGPGGRVTAEDVKKFAESPKKKATEKEAARFEPPEAARAEHPPLPDFSRWGALERVPLRSVRRTTAKRMALSWAEIPQVTHQDVADITELEAFRRDNQAEIEREGGKLTLTVFAMKAAVAALKAHPRFNASLDTDAREMVLKKYYHIGVAVDTNRGLLVAVVRDVDCKSMADLAKEVKALAERTRKGEVEPKDLSGGTFTITNIGPLGGTGFTPIINYPQVAILGLARARMQPMVRGDIDNYQITPRLMLPLCLGFDHRIVDGADAARFMGEVIRLLENPKKLMLVQ